ncbi:hypothetical protein H0H92_009350, partial [Tricholoma furcatifolium]
MVLADDYLGKAMQLDPIKLHKYEDSQWVRFYDEPLTANRAWSIQNDLPSDSRALLMTMYADKTRLGSFGNVMGHPVMIRFDNLSLDIRSGPGLGGVHIVGWLPIVEDDPAEQDKAEWVLFKKDVYHKCIRRIISTVKEDMEWGDWYDCAGTARHLFLIIHINALDYEEACSMTLIRGVMSHFPCPKCLVPRSELWNLNKAIKKEYKECTAQGSKELYNEALVASTKGEQDRILMSQGLRLVEAYSFDELHNNDHGVGGKHLFPEIVRTIKAMPAKQRRQAARQIGDHHNVLASDIKSNSYKLLCATRAYLNMTMWQTLEVATDKTIAAGREAVKRFGDTMNDYGDTLLPAGKSSSEELEELEELAISESSDADIFGPDSDAENTDQSTIDQDDASSSDSDSDTNDPQDFGNFWKDVDARKAPNS